MNIKFLETFVWVARLRSFRAAAEKLYVSQATISSRIALLETEFKCILFDRKHNEINLTDKGFLLLENAEKVLHAEQMLKDRMHGDFETTRRIRIGVIESVVYTWLDVFLTQLKEKYPKLEFELTAESTTHLQSLFAKGSLDIIIQTDPIPDETVINTALESLEIVWVCCKNSDLANRPVSLVELADSQIITFTRGSQPHLSVVSMFERIKLKPEQIHCVASISIICKLVKAKLGIATLPVAAIKDEIESNQLAVINCLEAPNHLELFASRQQTSDDMNKHIIDLLVSTSKCHSKS